MKRNPQFSFFLSFLLGITAYIIFPQMYFSKYWMLLCVEYFLAVLLLFGSLSIIFRMLRYDLSYVLEIPKSLQHLKIKLNLVRMLFFFIWFLIILYLFPKHTFIISTVLICWESLTWWKKHKNGISYEK